MVGVGALLEQQLDHRAAALWRRPLQRGRAAQRVDLVDLRAVRDQQTGDRAVAARGGFVERATRPELSRASTSAPRAISRSAMQT